MPYDRLDEDGLHTEPDNHSTVIQPGTDEELTVYGYQNSGLRSFFFYLASVLTVGGLCLVSYWKPEWWVSWKKRKCSLFEADALIIKVMQCIRVVLEVDYVLFVRA